MENEGIKLTMESQTLKWKESWHDEYMKTLCAFANTSGGTLEVGRNDNGLAIGVERTAKLLEDLPNRIKNAMAIIFVRNGLNQQ